MKKLTDRQIRFAKVLFKAVKLALKDDRENLLKVHVLEELFAQEINGEPIKEDEAQDWKETITEQLKKLKAQ